MVGTVHEPPKAFEMGAPSSVMDSLAGRSGTDAVNVANQVGAYMAS